MLKRKKIIELSRFATQIRIETIKEIAALGVGHVGGAMSLVDTLAVLYGEVMKVRPTQPNWPDRDWLVLSKGHAGPALYATLALKGYFPLERLNTLNCPGTTLPSHCDRNKTPGVDVTTGSLGQGTSCAAGIALAHLIDRRDNLTYLIIGDGECDEGQVWEAALFAAHRKLSNLIAFIDCNRQQIDGFTSEICELGDLAEKFKSFGWHAQSVDGHNVADIYDAIQIAKTQQQPAMIVLNTVKGKGCCFAEGTKNNHHMTVSYEEMEQAVSELERTLTAI